MNDTVAYSLAETFLFLADLLGRLTATEMAAWGLGLTYALWIFFLAVMNLSRAREAGTLQSLALLAAYPVLWVGLILDLIVNLFIASPLLLDFPRETTVTAKLGRLIRTKPDSWRGKCAFWFCSVFLDTFDPSGKHCK